MNQFPHYFVKKMPWRFFILPILLLSSISNVDLLLGQQDSESSKESVYVDGLLVSKKKYSFTVAGADKDHVIKLTPATIFAARIVRPNIDWKLKRVTGQIPASAPDGRLKNNLKVVYELPKKVYFRHRFDNAQQLNSALSASTTRLNRLILSKTPLPNAVSDGEKPEWTGELLVSPADGALSATGSDEKVIAIKSSWSTLLVEGFNLLDLNPFETDVFVNAVESEEGLVAKRVEFTPRVDLKKIFSNPHPKCLVVGDTVSFNYLAALTKALEGEAIIHHPNANCLGSSSHKHLHRWLATCRMDEMKWDVVVFNFGLSDSGLDKKTYQDNLKKCVEELKRSGAALVWVESTPVPYGFNDPNLKPGEFIPKEKQFDFEFEEENPSSTKPGRMRVQNKWAEEVLDAHPEIKICKLWDVVKKDADGKFKTWWFGKSVNFKFPQSIPLAEALAKSIRASISK